MPSASSQPTASGILPPHDSDTQMTDASIPDQQGMDAFIPLTMDDLFNVRLALPPDTDLPFETLQPLADSLHVVHPKVLSAQLHPSPTGEWEIWAQTATAREADALVATPPQYQDIVFRATRSESYLTFIRPFRAKVLGYPPRRPLEELSQWVVSALRDRKVTFTVTRPRPNSKIILITFTTIQQATTFRALKFFTAQNTQLTILEPTDDSPYRQMSHAAYLAPIDPSLLRSSIDTLLRRFPYHVCQWYRSGKAPIPQAILVHFAQPTSGLDLHEHPVPISRTQNAEWTPATVQCPSCEEQPFPHICPYQHYDNEITEINESSVSVGTDYTKYTGNPSTPIPTTFNSPANSAFQASTPRASGRFSTPRTPAPTTSGNTFLIPTPLIRQVEAQGGPNAQLTVTLARSFNGLLQAAQAFTSSSSSGFHRSSAYQHPPQLRVNSSVQTSPMPPPQRMGRSRSPRTSPPKRPMLHAEWKNPQQQ